MIWYQALLETTLNPGLPGVYHDGNVEQRISLAGCWS